jgi:dethiobiotin synthetase
MKGFFITGTDTGVGKTTITCALLRKLSDQGQRTASLKPIATGAVETTEGWRNEDGLALAAACSSALTYEIVNPLLFKEPLAPSIAANRVGVTLSLAMLRAHCQPALTVDADYLLVEGVGGWLVPLNSTETMADFAQDIAFPVILVVGMRLGCLNHALLTVQSISHAGLTLAGWVANYCFEDYAPGAENCALLQQQIAAPLLGIKHYHQDICWQVSDF